ncbi:GNAT family N-acetyltransferase [Myceligenerans pegani]|uniref:GNAT family N-acetyltransferase n=1 Tax=Myceligenerans pegani TaxID=2776917 RepID=UPI001CF0CDDF|nr:GNAT family protein [Myceligenerans sp. TRM 65318]
MKTPRPRPASPSTARTTATGGGRSVWLPCIDDRYRTAEFFIYIGEPSERGRGTGTSATTMVLDWAFHITALRCVHLSVIAQNTGAIRAYEKAGFRIVGTRRRTGSWLGQPADEVIMDAVPEEYEGPRLVEAAVLGAEPGAPSSP